MDMYGKYDGHIFPYCMYLYVVSFQGSSFGQEGLDTMIRWIVRYATMPFIRTSVASDLGSPNFEEISYFFYFENGHFQEFEGILRNSQVIPNKH